jgi:hypothetical protein
MALSDYLTSDEWDACYYAFRSGASQADNFGDSMHRTIERLLATGYRFPGLTEGGEKHVQIVSDNATKFVQAVFHEMDRETFLGIVESGRAFLREHCPDMLVETDQEWSDQIAQARGSRG